MNYVDPLIKNNTKIFNDKEDKPNNKHARCGTIISENKRRGNYDDADGDDIKTQFTNMKLTKRKIAEKITT